MSAGTRTSALRGASSAPKPPSPASSAGGTLAMFGSRPGVDVEIPRTKIGAWMTQASRADVSRIRAEARKHFLELGYAAADLLVSDPDLLHDMNAEIAVRTLAIAVRSPEDHGKPLDTLASWRENVDDEQIAALWTDYKAFVDLVDPIGAQGDPLSEHELAQLESAAKKKDVGLLMSFGLRKLALYAITSVAPPAS